MGGRRRAEGNGRDAGAVLRFSRGAAEVPMPVRRLARYCIDPERGVMNFALGRSGGAG